METSSSSSSQAVVYGRDLADYCRRMRVSDALYKLASDLDDLFLGYEELSSMMRAASIEIENLAEQSVPFQIDHTF